MAAPKSIPDLIAAGYVRQTDGSWSKPKRIIGSLGGLETDLAKSTPVQTLEPRLQKQTGSTKGVAIDIILVSLRKRLLDSHDNLAFSFKPLTDAIAETIGIDDADSRMRWQFHQLQTKGKEGVIVYINRSL